jgi:hypothetical protein
MTGWRRLRPAAPLLVCTLLAVLHTWPLATAPHALSRHENADVMLNEWIVAWVQHQLPRDPRHLFQGNIFYPARDTLAFSEPLIVPALLGAPVRWAGGSPVLVHNVLLIAGLALTALAAYAAAYAWTGDRLAALVAGSAFAFNTHLLIRLTHLQALHAYGLPLALLATDRLLSGGRTHDAMLLALWMTLLAYTSGHLLVFATVMVGVAIAVRPGDWVPRWRQVLPRFALATVVASAAAIPLLLPYRRAAVEQEMVRPLEMVGEFSASVGAYAASTGDSEISAFFPGVAVLALSIAAIAAALRAPWNRGPDARRTTMLCAIGAAGFVLSLGTNTPVYGWLYEVFPPLRGIRAAARFVNLFLLAAALLAGIGTARLRASGVFGRWSTAAGVAAIVAVNAGALRAPIAYQPFEGIPNLYSILANEPGRVVLVEQPFYPPEGIFQNAEYVLNSTRHWRPLMNGYSGVVPASYQEYAKTFWYFPREHAVDAMRQAGVTHVMVHPLRYGSDEPEMQRLAAASPYLERIAVGRNGMTLYRLR